MNYHSNLSWKMILIYLLKLFNLKINNLNYTNILERIEMLIDLLFVLNISQILAIPNLKKYLLEELVELYKYSLYNNIKITYYWKRLQK